MVLWHLWIGRARHPGPGSVPFLVEVLTVGGWLTHCDFALDVGVDFLAVVEHRLIPAGVRSEWAASFGRLLRRRRLMWVMPGLVLLACVVHLCRCLLLLLLSFSVFLIVVGLFDVCFLWVVGGGADRDPKRLTDQLLDAALGELGVVAREQPCLLVGDFNMEPTKIPCLAKGIMAGLWVDLEASWALASGRNPGVTCKQDLGSSLGLSS